MTTADNQPDGPVHSRLEDEVLEILHRSDRPISFAEHQRRLRRQAHQRMRGPVVAKWRSTARFTPGAFLLLGVVAALLAFAIRETSPFLARVLALGCVLLLISPIFLQCRSPRGETSKRWRGRDVDFSAPSSPPQWLDTLRDRFRRPPRL